MISVTNALPEFCLAGQLDHRRLWRLPVVIRVIYDGHVGITVGGDIIANDHAVICIAKTVTTPVDASGGHEDGAGDGGGTIAADIDILGARLVCNGTKHQQALPGT